MNLRSDSLRVFFDASPTARLLRSDLAPQIIDFLNRTFKSGAEISLGQADLRGRLLVFLEELHEVHPELMTGSPDRYLVQWSDAGWLQRFLESTSSEPQFQLTRYAEDAIRFVDSAIAKSQSLVGTESRLRLVINSLEDLVRGASADPEKRLEYLRQQREAIDQEIREIESGKSVQVYRPAQIRERFQIAVELLKTLQSDFRAVEERFQEIARDVQRLQAVGHESRGGILGFALDAEDLLKQQDEGVSFYAFVAFLFSPTEQAALRKNIEELQKLAALADQQESMQRVRKMVPSLLAEAEKVMKTTARLSATLRRLLDARAAAQRKRLAEVLLAIRHAAMGLREQAPLIDITLSPAAEIEISSPLARPFWTPPPVFATEQPQVQVIDLTMAQSLANQFAKLHRLDIRKLRSRIREATYRGEACTLSQLIAHEPITGGVVEVLGYLQIAHDDGHRIDGQLTETLELPSVHDARQRVRLVVPHVTYLPKANSRIAGTKPR